MTTEPAGRDDLAGLLERLLKERVIFEGNCRTREPRNVDGPEAHAVIIKLEKERDDALEQEQFWQQGCNKLETKNLLLEQENAKLRERRGIDAATFHRVRGAILRTGLPGTSGITFTQATHEVFDIITQFYFGHAAEALRADGEEGYQTMTEEELIEGLKKL